LYSSEINQVKRQALQYFMHYGPAALRLELAGTLDGEGARRLERDWLTASSALGGHALIVDLTFVNGAEEEGRALLARWFAAGVRFVAQSKVSRKLAQDITGKPIAENASVDKPGADRTWLPFRKTRTADDRLKLALRPAGIWP
jgi:hypothetical protein